MTSTAPPRTAYPDQRATPPLVLAALTLLAYLSQHVLPRGHVLFTIPAWITPVAAGLGFAAALALHLPVKHLRTVFAINGAALAMLLLTAGGVLFDIVMTISWRVVPAFRTPDWPVAATRVLAFVTAIVLFRAVVHYRRCARGERPACGRSASTPPVRQRLWLGYAGFLFGLPYPVIKTSWALGGTIGLDYPSPTTASPAAGSSFPQR
jgi:hypothetical protein